MGTLLYYVRAVDPTMLTSLGSITAKQANSTEQTMQILKQLLDYAASHPDDIIAYKASEMVLAGHRDASYLSKTKACRRAGVHLFISSSTAFPPNNGSVFIISKIINTFMSSAVDAELGSLFLNCKEVIPSHQALEEMGH